MGWSCFDKLPAYVYTVPRGGRVRYMEDIPTRVYDISSVHTLLLAIYVAYLPSGPHCVFFCGADSSYDTQSNRRTLYQASVQSCCQNKKVMSGVVSGIRAYTLTPLPATGPLSPIYCIYST